MIPRQHNCSIAYKGRPNFVSSCVAYTAPRRQLPSSSACHFRNFFRVSDVPRSKPKARIPASQSARTSRISKRSEEHTSELQSLMRISYAVFCLKKKHKNQHTESITHKSQKNNIRHLNYTLLQ